MNDPGDVLAQMVRQHVATLVSPELVDTMTMVVGQALSTLLGNPTFTSQLLVVHDLQLENQMLKQNVLVLQRMLAAQPVVYRKAAAKKAPAKKAAPRKSPAKKAFDAEVRRSRR